MREQIRLKGCYVIEARDAASGAVLWSQSIDNMLTTISRDARAQMLMGAYSGDGSEFEIKYFGFGTGATSPTINDTQLEAEVYRKQITQISADGGVVTSVVSLGAAECNYIIREIGVFCGPSASSAVNSGLLLSRATTFVDKNTNLVLNIVRRDICTI